MLLNNHRNAAIGRFSPICYIAFLFCDCACHFLYLELENLNASFRYRIDDYWVQWTVVGKDEEGV